MLDARPPLTHYYSYYSYYYYYYYDDDDDDNDDDDNDYGAECRLEIRYIFQIIAKPQSRIYIYIFDIYVCIYMHMHRPKKAIELYCHGP
jgi:hypothetical protein